MSADLPPSSRKVRFIVSAPCRINRFPTAVEPVNEIMSTRGSVANSSATSLAGVGTTLSTPAGMSVCSATKRPSRVAFHGVWGSGLRMTVLPVASAGPSLLRMTSIGKLDGVIAPTTPTGSLTTVRTLRSPNSPPPSSTRSHSKSSMRRAGISQRLRERPVELSGADGHVRTADLGDQFLAQVIAFGLDGRLQLLQATLAERTVGGPVGFVERPSGSADGPTHVVGARCGGASEDRTGCGADIVEFRPGGGRDQLAVDQHPRLGAFGGSTAQCHARRRCRLDDFAHAHLPIPFGCVSRAHFCTRAVVPDGSPPWCRTRHTPRPLTVDTRLL